MLWRLLQAFSRRIPRTSVELEPVDQWIILTLARFGECTFRRLAAELEAIRGTPAAAMVVAVAKMERDGLLERTGDRSGSRQQSSFRLSKLGRSASRVIPPSPTSPLDFYP